MTKQFTPVKEMYVTCRGGPSLSYWGGNDGLTGPVIQVGEHKYYLSRYLICEVEGVSDEEPPAPEPTLADVVALLERQAKTCECIASTLGKIAETVKGL